MKTNKQPERSVEEIVDKYWAKNMTLFLAQDLEKDINELLQAERQRCEEMVEELLNGVAMGSDGERNCYFVPVERIDSLLQTTTSLTND